MRAFNLIAEKQFNREGFQLTFENGNTISVMWGDGTYSDRGQTTAEVAAWNKNGNWMVWNEDKWITLGDYETEVMPRITSNQLAELMATLSK